MLLLTRLEAEKVGIKIGEAYFSCEDGERSHEGVIFLTQPTDYVPDDLVVGQYLADGDSASA